jgi:cation transporter-like permease
MADTPAPPKQKQPKQTGALISHYLFKTAAVVWFILGSFFISGFVLNFVVALVLIALDFWMVRMRFDS